MRQSLSIKLDVDLESFTTVIQVNDSLLWSFSSRTRTARKIGANMTIQVRNFPARQDGKKKEPSNTTTRGRNGAGRW